MISWSLRGESASGLMFSHQISCSLENLTESLELCANFKVQPGSLKATGSKVDQTRTWILHLCGCVSLDEGSGI